MTFLDSRTPSQVTFGRRASNSTARGKSTGFRYLLKAVTAVSSAMPPFKPQCPTKSSLPGTATLCAATAFPRSTPKPVPSFPLFSCPTTHDGYSTAIAPLGERCWIWCQAVWAHTLLYKPWGASGYPGGQRKKSKTSGKGVAIDLYGLDKHSEVAQLSPFSHLGKFVDWWYRQPRTGMS